MGDALHKAMSGTDLHVPGYKQDTDPGNVGSGMYWIDTAGGAGAWVLKVRNNDNSAWESVASGGSGGGSASEAFSFTKDDLVNGILNKVHGKGIAFPIVAVYSEEKSEKLPDEVKIVDENTVRVDLSTFGEIQGTWTLVIG